MSNDDYTAPLLDEVMGFDHVEWVEENPHILWLFARLKNGETCSVTYDLRRAPPRMSFSVRHPAGAY